VEGVGDAGYGKSAGAPGVVIETARLRIRSLRDDDLADLVALIGNWEVARWVSSHPYSEADGREWIAQVQQDHATGRPRRFAIALKKTDRIIGGVGLDGDTGSETEEAALGYWLGQPYWRNVSRLLGSLPPVWQQRWRHRRGHTSRATAISAWSLKTSA
jgi:RimJ/RimL family protein N-acetyltransferase